MAEAKAAGWRAMRRGLGRIGYRRLAVTLLLLAAAILTARYAWQMPLGGDAERALYDFRAYSAMPRAEQDPRIVLVTYTDDTLEATGRRSPLDRSLLARALRNIDAMHPKAIGVDILIDQPQPEDAELQAALRGMKTPTWLGFAPTDARKELVLPWQEAFQRQFQASLKPGNARPASVRLDADSDGVVRNWPRPQAGDATILADAMAGAEGSPVDFRRSIAFRLPKFTDIPLFNSIPIDLFGSDLGAQLLKKNIEGRYVLIGGDITNTDRFDVTGTWRTHDQITGLQIHASLLAQRLDARTAMRPSGAMLWALCMVVVLGAAATGWRDFGWLGTPVIVGELALVAAAPFAIQWLGVDSQPIPAFGWLLGWTLAYSGAAAAARGLGSEQRRFAQSALGRYLPPEIAREILRDPDRLNLSGERREIFALFSDIEGFTTMTHAIPAEQTASLLNKYLDRMSDIVLDHGGTIDKFVGDAVVAFWGAPIARANDAEMAIRTVIAMAEAGDAFSAEARSLGVTVGRTRVGLHRGEAIVGNFGGDGRIQYTALGDVMNAAARLEGANKKLQTRALVSEEAISGDAGTPLMPMGRVALRGRATPIRVYEPRPGASATEIAEVGALLAGFDAGTVDADALDRFAATKPGDAAIANLMYRLKQAGPGGYYALD